jgi:hypothetical protein
MNTSAVEWALSDLNRRPPGHQPDRQRMCRSEPLYALRDPVATPIDAFDRSFAWLAEPAYFAVVRSSTENYLVRTSSVQNEPDGFHSFVQPGLSVLWESAQSSKQLCSD